MEDEYDDNSEEEYDEEREQMREDERRAECQCGAFQYINGRYIRVADCVCFAGAY